MRKKFEIWMKKKEMKTKNVVAQYSTAINYISNHYNEQTEENIDLYKIDDIDYISELVKKYDKGGEYEEIGDKSHGTIRAAIKTYERFLKDKEFDYDSQGPIDPDDNSILKNKKKFKKWMIKQKGLEKSTASNYITGINKISSHYSQINNEEIDLFNENNKTFINGLVREYGQGGIYKEIGNIGHAYVRAAIIKYAEFLEHENAPQKSTNDLIKSDKEIKIKKNFNLKDKKKKLLPKNKHEILNKSFDFMLPILPEYIGNTLQKRDRNTWWQRFVLNKLPPNTTKNLPQNGTYEKYINILDIISVQNNSSLPYELRLKFKKFLGF